MKRVPTIGLGVVCIFSALANLAHAQGVLLTRSENAAPLPRPGVEGATAYKIKELTVRARLVDQVARVEVSQTFVNSGSRQLDVSVRVPAAV